MDREGEGEWGLNGEKRSCLGRGKDLLESRYGAIHKVESEG